MLHVFITCYHIVLSIRSRYDHATEEIQPAVRDSRSVAVQISVQDRPEHLKVKKSAHRKTKFLRGPDWLKMPDKYQLDETGRFRKFLRAFGRQLTLFVLAGLNPQQQSTEEDLLHGGDRKMRKCMVTRNEEHWCHTKH